MFSNKDHSKMTLEELVSEQEKMKSQKTTTAVFVGFVVGVAVYAATNGKTLLTCILLLGALGIGSRHAQNLKNIEAEISRRKG
jgi:hypothetical protein